MKKRTLLGGLLLLAALAAACTAAVVYANRAEAGQAQLREIYTGAVLSALRQTEDMQLSLSKALLSADTGESARYLSEVAGGAQEISRSLSLLPLDIRDIQRAVKFANQSADYALALIAQGTLTDEDAKQLESLIAACAQYTEALYAAREQLTRPAPERADSEEKTYDSGVSYPTLIYDGPFSDARSADTPKGLGSREVTREEAESIAREFIGAERVTEVLQGADTGGAVPCYGVTLKLKDVTLEAAVTRQGGKVLFLFPDSGSFPAEKSVEECRENALLFLSRRGYENMTDTYFQVYEGVAVISFAAAQGDTLLYPDLIKVQVRMDTGEVVGLEARNYLMNHTTRGLMKPRLSEEEARDAVSDKMKVRSGRLCLIPTEQGEKLCYEFKGQYNGASYLTYIDAEDGTQRELFKVVETGSGLETV